MYTKLLHVICKPSFFIWLILLFLTISCSGSISPTVGISITPSSVLQEPTKGLNFPNATTIKKATASAPTSTTTASATAVSTPSQVSTTQHFEENILICDDGNDLLQIGELTRIEGTIFFTSGKSDLFALSGIPPLIQQVSVPFQNLGDYVFSPEYEWLVAYSTQPDFLPSSGSFPFYLVSKSGNVETVLVNTESVDQVVRDHLQAPTYYLSEWSFEWVNNHLLKVTLGYGENRPHLFVFRYFDIHNRKWLNESFKLPDQDHVFDWSHLSPDETRIIYLNKKNELVLYDLVSDRELWRVFADRYVLVYPTAQWSKDSKHVAFVTKHGGRDIQILSMDGKFYAKVRPLALSSPQEFTPGLAHYSWSPNNRFLAISGILSDHQTNSKQSILYLYDILEERYSFRCPTSDVNQEVFAQIPLFSPDGNFLTTRFVQNNVSNFRLYDLQNRKVYQIQEGNYGAEGWVDNFSLNWK